jgi:putative transposon-encoded protein
VLGNKEVKKNGNKKQLEIWKERVGWIFYVAVLTKTVSDDWRET